MKKMKRLTALVLCLCLMAGLPLSVQAVGSSAPTSFDLVGAMVLTETNRVNKSDIGTLAILYLNGQSTHGYANLNSLYDVRIEVLSGQTRMAMSAAVFAATNNHWHDPEAPTEMQSVRCPAVQFADTDTTFASYIAQGATDFKLYITEKNSNKNGKLDDWKSKAGLSLTANTTYENADAVVCDIVAPEQYLTVKQALKTSATTVAVQFSEPVTLGTLSDGTNNGTLAVTVAAGETTDTATAYAIDDSNKAWVTFTFPQIADGALTLRLAEVTDNLDALSGQANFNALVEPIVSESGNKLLLADKRSAADTASAAVVDASLQLTGASLHGDTRLLLRFSEAVQLPGSGLDVVLSFYKDGKPDAEAGQWTADAATAAYYGAQGDTLMMTVAGSASLSDAAEELGEEYTLGVTLTARTADGNGLVDPIKSQNGKKYLPATVRGEKDGVTFSVTRKDAFVELIGVEAYKEDTLLLRFNVPVTYDAKRGYLGLSLLNPADGNRFFYYSEQEPHTLYTNSEYTADPAGKKLCQWNLSWVGNYRGDATTLEVRLADGWTMSQIMKICEGSGGKLYLRIQEHAEHLPFSGTVGVVRQQKHGWDEVDYQLLATNRGKQDQVRFEVADCRNEVVVESATLVTDNTVKVVFNKPVSNKIYNPDNGGSALLRLARMDENGKWVGQSIFDGTEAPMVQWSGRLTNYDPNDPPETLPDAAAQTKEWYFRWSNASTDTTVRDLLAMTEDPDSVYADYELMLVLERNYKRADGTNLPISPNSVDNFTSDVDGDGNIDYILIQNNYNDGVTKYGSPGHYAAITADGLPALVDLSSVTVTGENEMTVVFSEAIASMKNVSASVRVTDADGNTLQSMAVTLTAESDGKTYTATVKPVGGAAIRNFSAAWQAAQESGGKLMLAIAQTDKADSSTRDGMVDGVRGVGGGKLISTVCRADEVDTCYKEITLDDFAFDPDSFTVEKVTQTGVNTLLVEFSEDIRLVNKESMFVALRMVDPAKNGALVKVGSRQMQWPAKTFDFADGRADALLVTFPDTVDIGLLMSKVNMDEQFIPYDMVFLIEESAGAAVSVKGDHLVHNIRRAADDKQLESTYKAVGTTSCDAICSGVELIDPTADITVEKTEVVDQSRIVITFSEAVVIDNPEAYIRLVDKDFNTMTDSDGNRVMWGGEVNYYNDAHTQIAFSLYGPGVSHKNLIVDGLDELFAAGYEKDGWNLMLAIGDRGGKQVLNGKIDSIVSTTGKILLADAFTGIIDQVFMDIDGSQIPQGELTMEKIEVVSDIKAIATFSAPVEVSPAPFAAIRLFDGNNRLLWLTADGKYTTANKNAQTGESNTAMQCVLKWEYANDEQTQIALTVNGTILGMGAYNDILTYDWKSQVLANCDEDITDAVVVFGFEELNSKGQTVALRRNNRVENIRLKGNEGVALTATKIGGYDGCYTIPKLTYTPQTLTASARIINEMQIRVSFSAPVIFTGDPFMVLRYVDQNQRYQIINYGEAPNMGYGQWGGKWEWEDEAHTSLIWTMNGKNGFGVNNLSDIVNKRWAMPMLPEGGTVMFCIEELNVTDVIKVGGRNSIIDNISTKDGANHLRANRAAGYDALNMELNLSSLKGANGVEILSAKAVDDQTIELTFSEAVLIDEGERAAKMNLYYRSISGEIDILANGKSAVFKGTWEYKDENKNVILWKLNSKNADSLTDIYNYAGNLKWNVGADVVFMIENDEEIRPSRTERMWGISSLDGMRLLKADYSTAPHVEVEVEIAYDLPKPETETDADTEPAVRTEYVTDYLPFILGGGAAVLVMAAVTVIVLVKRKKEENK